MLIFMRGLSDKGPGLSVLVAYILATSCNCVDEPDPVRYYESPAKDGAPPRVRNLSPEDFIKLAQAGKPFVVTDMIKDLKMAGWTCDTIREEFKDGRMHQEYGASAARDLDDQRIGDLSWKTAKAPSGAADRKAPQLAPFYWGVKDGKDRQMLHKVRQFVTFPYFMDEQRNFQEVMGSPEFWFSMPGAGAKAHMDAHCESTMTLQLDGSKRWRIALASQTNRSQRLGTYGDGAVYRRAEGWQPTYDFVLEKGEALFFPPAFIHESTNVGDNCAASITHQYSYPMASGFFRAWWPRTRRIGDMNECWGKISSWANLGRHGVLGQPRTAASVEALRLFKAADTNGDGSLAMPELTRSTGHHEAAMNSRGFHDTDQDGVISEDEFVRNYVLWSAHEHEVHKETGTTSWHLSEGGYDGDDGDDHDGNDHEL